MDLMGPFWTTEYEKTIMGGPQYPLSVLEEHVAAMTPGAVVSHAPSPERLAVAMSMVQHGKYGEYLMKGVPDGPVKAKIFAEERVKNARLPPTFIYHGTEDGAAPVVSTEQFVDNARENRCDVQFVKLPGMDHLFDCAVGLANVDEPDQEWLKTGLTFITDAWLS